jgi:hypothetical protein
MEKKIGQSEFWKKIARLLLQNIFQSDNFYTVAINKV